MFHRHNWNLIDKTILPPALKQSGGGNVKGPGEFMGEFLDSFHEHVVLTFKCDCGKIRVEKR